MSNGNSIDKRLISGDRVACDCSVLLPKIDAFEHLKVDQKGTMVLNTRGCALYLPCQFTEKTITKLFVPGKPGLIKKVILYPPESLEIRLGNINARFLRFTGCEPDIGMVLRFVNLTESQMTIINRLIDQLPPAKVA